MLQPAAASRYLLSVMPQPLADMSNDYRSFKVTHNPSQSVQPHIFKAKLSIWVCSICLLMIRLKFECDNLTGEHNAILLSTWNDNANKHQNLLTQKVMISQLLGHSSQPSPSPSF